MNGLTIRQVKRVKDAQGCYCEQCKTVIADDCSPFWHWTKSKWMHERGMGHKLILFRYGEALP